MKYFKRIFSIRSINIIVSIFFSFENVIPLNKIRFKNYICCLHPAPNMQNTVPSYLEFSNILSLLPRVRLGTFLLVLILPSLNYDSLLAIFTKILFFLRCCKNFHNRSSIPLVLAYVVFKNFRASNIVYTFVLFGCSWNMPT